MGRPGLSFALIALAAWVAAVIAIAWPRGSLGLILVPLGLWVGSRILAKHRIWLRRLAFLTLPLVAVLLSTAIHHGLRNPDALTEAVGEEITLEFVTERTVVAGDSFVRGAISTADGQSVGRVPGMAFVEGVTERLPPGVTLSLRGSVVPGQRVDTRAWLVFAEEWSLRREPPKVLAWADSLREDFMHRTREIGGDGGALLPGLALGDTEAVSESLEFDMRRAALAHLVAVSGANVALVVGLAVLLSGLLGAGVWWRVAIGLITLFFFIVLVTPEPSVVRASVMATLVLLAAAIGRPQAGLVTLSVTVWILLLLDPWQAVDIAFVLSVAATGGIVLAYRPAARLLESVMPRILAYILALPLVAQLAVQPFVILMRPTIPTYGIVANFLAAPLVPLVTVSGLLGSILGPIVPVASDIFARVGWLPATLIAGIARAVAQLPVAEIPWPPAPLGFILALLASAGAFAVLSWTRRRMGAIALLGAIGVAVASTHGPVALTRLTMPTGWQIAQCDVGQGDALLVKTTRGIVAIDTGDDEVALRRCLASTGVKKVAVLILTHFDRDHVGQTAVFHGLADTVLHGPPDNEADVQRLSRLAQSGSVTRQVAEGDGLAMGNYRLRILWPSPQNLSESGNDSSVVALLDPIERGTAPSLIALGDLGESAQRMVRSRMPLSRVDVVKVSHHGSPDQSRELYETLGATVALIGVGADNDYGHPAPSTLSVLEHTGGVVVRSDRHGLATVQRDGRGLTVWSERDG